MFFITGDTHRSFERIDYFCNKYGTSKDDTMIILGDAGINYYGGIKDYRFKEYLDKMQITFFCIHGNHEMRPSTISSYKTQLFCGGKVYYEESFPSILFAIDGEVYTFDGKDYLVIGGAYSVDKDYRLRDGSRWFSDEQPSQEIKDYVEMGIANYPNKESGKSMYDGVFSHTCPANFVPTEVFLSYIDQTTVDRTTENWLQDIYEKIVVDTWYCGHYHTDKVMGKVRFMCFDIKEL